MLHPHLCLSCLNPSPAPHFPLPLLFSLPPLRLQIEILTVKGAHFYEMGMRAADLVVLGQARLWLIMPPNIRASERVKGCS